MGQAPPPWPIPGPAETAGDANWLRREDRWNGTVWETPPAWTVTARDHFYLAASPDGESAALVWPDPAPGPLEGILQYALRTLAAGDASLQAWAQPEEALAGGGARCRTIFERQGRSLLRGQLEATRDPRGGVLVRGWQAPVNRQAADRSVLDRILGSFQPIPPLPRRQYVEPGEGAFSVLVPEGWNANGRVDRSGGPHGLAVRWSVEDPATGARAFHDGQVLPFSAPAFGGVFGDMLGGLFGGGWNQLPFTPAVTLCQNTLFQMARQSRPDLRLVSAVPDPALEAASRESLRPVAARFGGEPAVTGAVATTEYSEAGRWFREVLAVTTWALPMAGTQWFASLGPGLRAPVDVFAAVEAVLAGIVLSYRANQSWESWEMDATGRRMAEERAQAEQYRAAKWRETQDYCQRVDREIQASHAATNAEIARGSYNLIAGREDVLGEGHHSYKVDSGYETYWEKDDRIMGSNSTDFDTHLEANGWKKMRVF